MTHARALPEKSFDSAAYTGSALSHRPNLADASSSIRCRTFSAGLKDSDPRTLPSPTDKDAIVKFLSDSFDYCSAVIPNLTAEQLGKPHNSPDGRLLGREILLAMYVHVAHHRGQAEIYLRDKGKKPPSYRI